MMVSKNFNSSTKVERQIYLNYIKYVKLYKITRSENYDNNIKCEGDWYTVIL